MTVACQCDRFPGHPCDRAITQEDLRCDVCGGRFHATVGCGSLTFENGPGIYHLESPVWSTLAPRLPS